MKKIFFWLLKKYSKTEKDRIEIFSHLHKSVAETYTEQTGYGNLYNGLIEFMMSSNVMKTCVKNTRRGSTLSGKSYELDMIKSGLLESYDRSIEFLKKEGHEK